MIDVVAIGNALVDVLSHESDEFVTAQGMVKGTMALIDTERAESLYSAMNPAVEISGGSAANTVAGLASLGSSAAFIGRVRDDQLGAVYRHDLRAAGVQFDTPPATDGMPSGRCLIVVTPDAERTLNTYLGASSELGEAEVDPALIASAEVTYLEGYLWDSPEAQAAYRVAAQHAHDAGRRVALTLSDLFAVERHRETFLDLVEHSVDILFANEAEICALYEVEDFDTARRYVTGHCEMAALTRGEKGAVILRGKEVHVVDAHPIPGGKLIDTTGAGDLYAAGFLHGFTRGYDLDLCGRIGALAAAEIISHIGARPEADLAELVAPLLPVQLMAKGKLPRYRTGDPELDEEIAKLVALLGGGRSDDLIFELIASAVRLARDGASRGDLKVANTTLKELRYAFYVFAPYRAARKAAIFGSARTRPDDPLYDQARRLAAALAEREWMIITGAGPGIMTAGIEGAGVESAFGVTIRLPFEATTSEFLEGDPKLVNFRYFFTRKLTFVKESDGFALLPGGYGTLDEAFETLTLIQTGKAQPAPIVLLDVPGGTYWTKWLEFVEAELAEREYISSEDLKLVYVTDDVDAAVDELTGFYANYHSLRFVEGELVLRVHHAPDADPARRAESGVRGHRRAG